jgi:hypothetical protein
LPVAVADDNVDSMIELLRSDLRADKKAIVGAAMDLSAADAELFWRHYDAYERERANLGDRTVDLIKRLQVEHRLHLLLHLQIAAEIPMVVPIKR